MPWLNDLLFSQSTAHSVLILAAAIAIGLALGQIRIAGVSFGIAGVLFAGLFFGHLGLTLEADLLEFARDFGLVLFVFTIGLQVGPGFFASLRKQGLNLNLLASLVVFLGIGLTILLGWIFKLPLPALVGMLSGAVTNTPGLGAAQQALRETTQGVPDPAALSGMAYAVAYPFGVVGIILTMLLARFVFRVDLAAEVAALEAEHSPPDQAPQNWNLRVSNSRLAGREARSLARLVQADFVISRLLRGEEVMVVRAGTRLELGDTLHVVATREGAEQLAIVVGELSETDVRTVPSELSSRNLLITRKAAVGRSIGELDLLRRHGAVITRVQRAGVELVASAGFRLNFGDRATIVGDKEAIVDAAAELGDSLKALNAPNLAALFFGVILGVVLGSIPFQFPGLPAPVKLGLAGGPLLVALILGRLGRIGPLVFYLPQSANLALREVGITLFLAAVGIKSGAHFVETLTAGPGLLWMGLSALITLLPLVLVALLARLVLKINFASLTGLLAGSMTDPPALSFAQTITGSDAPAVTYASVYALVMFLRILGAQALVILLSRS